jgi:hypothetical protein
MIIRDGTWEDWPEVLELVHEVHGIFPEPIRSMPLNDAQCQRVYVVNMSNPNGFVKVAEEDGKVTGCMVGLIIENHWGLQTAQDLFVLAHGATRRLLEAFRDWAEEKGADLTLITDLCGRPGYEDLIKSVGFKPTGTVLMRAG